MHRVDLCNSNILYFVKFWYESYKWEEELYKMESKILMKI